MAPPPRSQPHHNQPRRPLGWYNGLELQRSPPPWESCPGSSTPTPAGKELVGRPGMEQRPLLDSRGLSRYSRPRHSPTVGSSPITIAGQHKPPCMRATERTSKPGGGVSVPFRPETAAGTPRTGAWQSVATGPDCLFLTPLSHVTKPNDVPRLYANLCGPVRNSRNPGSAISSRTTTTAARPKMAESGPNSATPPGIQDTPSRPHPTKPTGRRRPPQLWPGTTSCAIDNSGPSVQ